VSGSGLFGDLFTDFFGAGAVPPESVARKILGIGTTLPLDRDGIAAAFRWRIKLLRPDLSDDQADALRMKHVVGEDALVKHAGGEEHYRPAGELNFESGSKAEQLAELLWAREDLLGRVPVTATAGATVVGGSSRNGSAPAPRPRPVVTADEIRSRATLGTRNARVFAEVAEALERYKRDAADYPESRTAKEWTKRSEDEHFTELAVNARLICSRCADLLASPVYVYRSADRYSIFVDPHERYVGADNLRAYCAACWEDEKRGKYFIGHESAPRACACATEVVCWSSDRYYSTRWWWSERARSCSPLCAREKRNADARGRRLEARENHRCAVCDETFTPARSDARYCSAACRQDAYRKRKLGAST
jgi:hypothetical protein